MAPDLDVYGLTRRRDLATINNFIDTYVDRTASEDRGDEELMLEPLEGLTDANNLNSYEWEPSISLTHIIERGLDQPPRAFANYLKTQNTELDGAIICFTSDNQVVLGVSIDEGVGRTSLNRAREVLEELARKYDCHLALIGAEFPPPRSEKEFRDAKNDSLVVFFKKFEAE